MTFNIWQVLCAGLIGLSLGAFGAWTIYEAYVMPRWKRQEAERLRNRHRRKLAENGRSHPARANATGRPARVSKVRISSGPKLNPTRIMKLPK